MSWTEEKIGRLKAMWAEGLTTSEIGRQLGISKNAVVGKAHRLHLDGRPSPIKIAAKKVEVVSMVPQRAKMTSAQKKIDQSVNQGIKPTVSMPVATVKVPVKNTGGNVLQRNFNDILDQRPAPVIWDRSKGGVTLSDLTGNSCRFPIGDPKDANFHFCGKKIMDGRPYCEEHAKLSFVNIGSHAKSGRGRKRKVAT